MAEAGCPVINGKYVMDTVEDGEKKRFSNTMFTRVAGNVYSYTITDNINDFQVADGKWKPVRFGDRTGKARIFCSGQNTVQIEAVADDGGSYWSKLTPLDEKRLKYETDVPNRSGVYHKL